MASILNTLLESNEEFATFCLKELGWNTENIYFLDIILPIVTFEFSDENDNCPEGRTIWQVDLGSGLTRHKGHSTGAFWTEWE